MKLRQLMAARWFEEYQDIAGLLKKSEAIERWFRTPDNRIVIVGDTNGHVAGPRECGSPARDRAVPGRWLCHPPRPRYRRSRR